MSRLLSRTVCLALAVTLLVLGPFAAALAVHHALAAADHDGHQHSDTDLCEWVQHHTTHSLLAALPSVVSSAVVGQHEPAPLAILSSGRLNSGWSPRGPPLS